MRDTKIRDFGVEFYFSKFRMEPVMLSFLVPIENKKVKNQNIRINNCGIILKKNSRKLLFAISRYKVGHE